jgi:hypothetical protein
MNKRLPEEWVMKSYKLPMIIKNPLLKYNFQALGRMDTKLSEEWKVIVENLTNPPNVLYFDEHNFMSALWVIGGYELIRVLNKIDKRPEVHRAYELFTRVRVPMVKFEVPKISGKDVYPQDFGIARAAISTTDKSLGWAVADNTFISRDQLAQALYDLY